jgi:hypothetical protein
MRAWMAWGGLSLSAGIVGGLLISEQVLQELSVIAVLIREDTASLSATGAVPFVGMSDATWCVEDGGCWRVVRDGLELSGSEGTVDDRIGLEDGAVLVAHGRTAARSLDSLRVLGERLERDRAACLTVHRGQETITMGLLLPDPTGGADVGDPCAERTARATRTSRRRSTAAQPAGR